MVETMTVDGSAANSSACTAGGGKGAGVRDAGVRDAGVRDAGCLRGGLSVDSVVAGLDVAALKAEIGALSRVDAFVVARRSAVVAGLGRRDGDVGDHRAESVPDVGGAQDGARAASAARLDDPMRQDIEEREPHRDETRRLEERADRAKGDQPPPGALASHHEHRDPQDDRAVAKDRRVGRDEDRRPVRLSAGACRFRAAEAPAPGGRRPG